MGFAPPVCNAFDVSNVDDIFASIPSHFSNDFSKSHFISVLKRSCIQLAIQPLAFLYPLLAGVRKPEIPPRLLIIAIDSGQRKTSSLSFGTSSYPPHARLAMNHCWV